MFNVHGTATYVLSSPLHNGRSGIFRKEVRFRQITVIAHTLTSCARQGWWKHFMFLLDKYN